jgi:transposase-like protein
MPFILLPPLGGIRGGACVIISLIYWFIKEEKQHMPHPWKLLIAVLSEITRKNCIAIVCCPRCGNRHTYVRWGFYTRYLFNDELINIQRYRCDNDLCACKTFSILPHALLPITRASLCMLMYVLRMVEQGDTIAKIVRCTGGSRSRVQRWINKAVAIRDWFRMEGGSPCFSPDQLWTSFSRNFSFAFYPERFR